MTVTAMATFAATGRTVAVTVAVELATRRGTLAITPITAFGPAIFGTGKFRTTVATAAARSLGIPPDFRSRAGFRPRSFLSPDHAAQANEAQRAETASKEYRRPDTALFKDSFAAHLDILLTVRRTVSGVLGFDSGDLPQSGESSVLRLAQL